jgi:hypothetical protein
MSFREWLDAMRDEWEFHKRHPELFIIWAGVAWVTYTLAKEVL